MENQQQMPRAAELQRTCSVECEPKTLTKEQYDLARKLCKPLEHRDKQSAEMARAKELVDSNSVKDADNNTSGLKLHAYGK
ncbi:hypothetical protein DVH24_009476 [Malus domestica]|uniref:Uncharacterized protein n=1 Tax=Malus domestica TaxID=3750 RepID=A0A498ITY6_MALDO|nr:hypothetical protein DVH24_009476 [Malus domestica]